MSWLNMAFTAKRFRKEAPFYLLAVENKQEVIFQEKHLWRGFF